MRNLKFIKYAAILFAFGILTTFQACKIGEKYKQPNLNLPQTFRDDSLGLEKDTTQFSQIHWKELFRDSILLSLIDSGLANNNDMKTAMLNTKIANLQLRQNRANYLPTVDATIASANKQWRSVEFGSAPASKWYTKQNTEAPESMYVYLSQFGTDVSFSWELDIWGKISSQRDQLLAEYLNTNEAKNAIQTNLITNIANGYFNLLMLDAKIEVAKRNVQLNDSTLNMIKLQYEAGEITALAIQQTESQRLVAASLVPELEREITIQENALRTLTGQMPSSVQRAQSLQVSSIAEQKISLGSPLDIIRNRPDIRSAEFELVAANANANIQQTLKYPSLSIGGTLGVNAMLPKNWFNIPGALLGGLAGDLTTPIFNRKKLKTNHQIALIEREKVELQLQQSVVEAVSEVSNSIISVEKQREQLEFAQQRVTNAELAVRNANLLFRSGYATYLEVITAQSNALSSELFLVELRQQQLQSYVDLYRSLGGGWQE